MDRKAAWILAAALLTIAAITLSAATLDSTTGSSGVGLGGSGDGSESEDPDRDPSEIGSGSDSSGIGQGPGFPLEFQLPCFRLLVEPLVIVGFLATLFAIGAVATWRTNLGVGAAIVILVLFVTLPIYIFLTACVTLEADRELLPFGGGVGGEGEGGGLSFPAVTDSVTNPAVPEVLVLAVGVILVVTLVTWWLTGDRDLPGSSETKTPEPTPSPEADVEAVGRAAGRAADRLETGDEFENDVYRAWAEMTTELEVEHPRSSTPSEFAMAAVEAGMNRNDVDRLTNLFEAVRYGGFDPTSAREREAIETLRRIEDQYAGVDAEGA
ncbi:MAG: hypothetical protein ACI9YT_000481 [Halobacteriales archaeon]